jgi:hypothetical protein
MRKLCIIIILLISKLIIAQIYIPFPNDSAEWDFTASCNPPCNITTNIHPTQILQKGDSVKNGLTYHKLYSNTIFYCLYREFAKKIYVKYPINSPYGNDTSEFVLYDFNLNIGDTFTIKTPSTVSLPCQAKMKLTSIGTYSFGLTSGTRKFYYFSDASGCFMGGLNNVYWIEGIGCQSGLLYNMTYNSYTLNVSQNSYNYSLNCFIKGNNTIYGNCIATEVKTYDINPILQIFPNPAKNKIIFHNVNSNSSTISQITFYNNFGVIIFSEIFYRQNSLEVNLTELKPGIYFSKIYFENGTFIVKKIIRE